MAMRKEWTECKQTAEGKAERQNKQKNVKKYKRHRDRNVGRQRNTY